MEKYDIRIRSYKTLRKTVGILGLLLPVSLLIFSFLTGSNNTLESSISAYYYTDMRNVFVGVLCAVAIFMFFYVGYSWLHDWAGNIAGLGAVLTAWCPMNPPTGDVMWYNHIHLPAAAGLFLIFAFFSIWLFTQSKAGKIYRLHPTKEGWVLVGSKNISPQKKRRDVIYVICGAGIVLILLFLLFWMITQGETGTVVYWCEFAMLILFATSWLVKGEAVFWDPQKEDIPDEYRDKQMPLEEAKEKGYEWMNYNAFGLLKNN